MNLPNWLLVIVAPLGVARAVFLVMHDKLTEKPRHWLEHRGGYIGYWVTCPWCVSMWVAGGAAALLAWDYTRPVTMWLLVVGSLSIFTVLFERVIDRTPMFMDDPPFGTLPEHRPEVPDEVAAALQAALDREK